MILWPRFAILSTYMRFMMKTTRILRYAFLAALGVTGVKYLLHSYGLEPVSQTSVHNSLISSATFVIGFVLSAVIADYKESERIPAEFASTVEGIYEDSKEIHKAYPAFDLVRLRDDLIVILGLFREGTRHKRRGTRREISDLHQLFGQMEAAGVPPNFVVKLKQQQAQLLKSVYRVNYIQRIRFIPSAYVLVWCVTALVVAVLLVTKITPFYGGLVISGGVSFVLVYMVMLIHHISVPFRANGDSYDDVSLFLLSETKSYLQAEARADKKKTNKTVVT